ASILSQGLLQNLIVHEEADGLFAVDGGGRRLDALALLVERGQIAADFPVRVVVVEEINSTAASLAENVQREAMHPVDEFDAFSALVDENW
ncbi:hypothetical protein XEUV354_23520, partial [Xanthomonas euvesicatoria]|uniref:ParB/Srx family N-terminal domain-containing protein n=1 Tax=Xanthomonas euvesicatoria TaxID=456327 RepID=UPI00062D72F2